MDRAFGPAGRARGIQPETGVFSRSRGRLQLGRGGLHQGGERRVLPGNTDGLRCVFGLGQGGFYGLRVLRGIGDQRTLGVVYHVLIIGRPEQGVDRHRHNPGLDRPPKEKEEFGAVFDDHQQPLASPEAHRAERVAAAVDLLGQLPIAHIAVDRANGDFVYPPFCRMPVDKRHRHIEAWSKSNGGICWINNDGIGLHTYTPLGLSAHSTYGKSRG